MFSLKGVNPLKKRQKILIVKNGSYLVSGDLSLTKEIAVIGNDNWWWCSSSLNRCNELKN
jgi:hypothetical protein